MTFYKKILSVRHWIAFLRRQPRQIQHLVVFLVSGVITAILGACILYYDYGFWHETYSRQEQSFEVVAEGKEVPKQSNVPASPGDMIGGFLKEASSRLQSITLSVPQAMKGKETYKEGIDRDVEVTTETSLQKQFKEVK